MKDKLISHLTLFLVFSLAVLPVVFPLPLPGTTSSYRSYRLPAEEISPLSQSVQRYRGFEIKTNLVNDEIQYQLEKNNSVEFTINDKCELQGIKIKVDDKEYGYNQVTRVIEDGRIEKNDLFAYICYRPELLNNQQVNPEEVEFKFYRSKVSPAIDPNYPLFPTLKLTADKIGIKLPQRTFVVLNGLGSASHEFFCYLDPTTSETSPQNNCILTFDEVLEMHFANQNSVALFDLGDKYARKLDYEKAEKAYLKAITLPPSEGESNYDKYKPLAELYLSTGQWEKARKYLLNLIDRTPTNFDLYVLLAKSYLLAEDYQKATEAATNSLKINAEKGQAESYAIIGQAQLRRRNFPEAIKVLSRAAVLAEKDCQQDQNLLDQFLNKEKSPKDCRLSRVPYERLIIYGLLSLGEYEQAEKGADSLLKTVPDDAEIYGWMAFIKAGKGELDSSKEMADKCLALFRKRSLGASMTTADIYPLIISVRKDSPADRAGLKRGDSIIAVNGKDLRLFREQQPPDQMIAGYLKTGNPIELIIHSAGSWELKKVKITPEELLNEKAAPIVKLEELIASSKPKIDQTELKKLQEEFYSQ